MVDDFEFEGTDDAAADNGPKALRDALAKAKEELKALRAEKRQYTLTKTLKDKGLNPKVAKFVPEDADLDEWLTENADLFGASQAEADASAPDGGEQSQAAPEVPVEPSADEAGFGRLEQTVAGSSSRASVSPEIQGLMEAASKGPQAIADYMAQVQTPAR